MLNKTTTKKIPKICSNNKLQNAQYFFIRISNNSRPLFILIFLNSCGCSLFVKLNSSTDTDHYDRFLSGVNRVVVDHADDGHTQVTADAERDAEAQAWQDGDDVTARQPETRAVHDGKLLLLHQLRTTFCWQLDRLAILLTFLEESVGCGYRKCKANLSCV